MRRTDLAAVLSDRATLTLFAALTTGWFLPDFLGSYGAIAMPLFLPAYLVSMVTYDGLLGLEQVVYAIEDALGGEWKLLWDAGLVATFYLFSVVAAFLARPLERRFGPDRDRGDEAGGGGVEREDGLNESNDGLDKNGDGWDESGDGRDEGKDWWDTERSSGRDSADSGRRTLRYTVAAGLLVVGLLFVVQGVLVQPQMTAVSCSGSGTATDGGGTATATPDCTRTTQPATGARLYGIGLGVATGLLGAGVVAVDRRFGG